MSVPSIASFLLERIAEMEANADDPRGSYTPEFVRAECAAKRRIVEMHRETHACAPEDWENDMDGEPWFEAEGRAPAWVKSCPTLRALASVYVDAPGWREEWR